MNKKRLLNLFIGSLFSLFYFFNTAFAMHSIMPWTAKAVMEMYSLGVVHGDQNTILLLNAFIGPTYLLRHLGRSVRAMK